MVYPTKYIFLKSVFNYYRQREEDKLLQLKAKQQNITGDLEALRTKVKDLTDGIGDTRTGVADVKAFIDGMRSSRDTKVRFKIIFLSQWLDDGFVL